MNAFVKKQAIRWYRIINRLPFNNKRKGNIQIENNGAILWHCKIKSFGTGNHLVLRGGGYTLTANLFSLVAITQ